MMKAWDANPSFDFIFDDHTPDEIQTDSVEVVKRVLSRKIGEANYMVAIIGQHSNDIHHDHTKIGYRNWQAYEIAKNHEKGNGLVVVKIVSSNTAPNEAYGIGAKFVIGFSPDSIIKALSDLAS